jgi:hypothetical protein
MSKKLIYKNNTSFRDELIQDISTIVERRKNLVQKYGYIVDDDLIEANIYEELALKARYNYLLRIAKENNIKLSSSCIFIEQTV